MPNRRTGIFFFVCLFCLASKPGKNARKAALPSAFFSVLSVFFFRHDKVTRTPSEFNQVPLQSSPRRPVGVKSLQIPPCPAGGCVLASVGGYMNETQIGFRLADLSRALSAELSFSGGPRPFPGHRKWLVGQNDQNENEISA